MDHHADERASAGEGAHGPLHGSRHTWVVDVVQEGSAAVAVDGRQVTPLPRWLLPPDAKEGDVLTVMHDRHGEHSRLTIEIDRTATRDAYRRED